MTDTALSPLPPRRARLGRAAYLGFVGVVYAFLLLPLVVVVIASFNSGEILTFPPEGFSLRWYGSFFNSDAFMGSLFYSLRVALICTAGSTLLGTTVALYVVRHAGRWREHLRLFILMPLLLPEILTAIALLFFYYNIDSLLRAVGLDFMTGILRNSMVGLLIGHMLITLPFVFLGISSSLYNFDRSLEEAARNLGASRWTTFRRITLPIVKPGIIAGALLCFIISFDLFAISLLLKGIGIATLPIQLFDYVRWDFDPTAAAVSTVSIVITLAAIILTDRLVGLRSLRF
jgi:putative spermidine/putrescine transport system permease protein